MSEDTAAPEVKTRKKVEGVTKEAKITLKIEENPKREGSEARERFESYFQSETVGEFLDSGGSMGDINYDIIHGFIEVDGATITEVEVKPRGSKADTESEDEAEDEEAATGTDGF